MCGQFASCIDYTRHCRMNRQPSCCCVYQRVRVPTMQQDCPNGRLTPAKFVDMYKMFFPSGNAEEFCDHVFRTFDMDKNGYIDFKVSQPPLRHITHVLLLYRYIMCTQTRTHTHSV